MIDKTGKTKPVFRTLVAVSIKRGRARDAPE